MLVATETLDSPSVEMEPQGLLGTEGDGGLLGLLVPSPQSEAVTHELEELSLQPSNNLPPLNERKNVLQLRLQQRRTREQLVDQGIMPPLKSPAAFHEQIRSLERARTENFLKHKIRSRPERSELVRMHILKETGAEPSLQATQMRLKRARLADDLKEKLAQRPGPMELVEKNILPVEPSVKEAIIVNYPKSMDYGCEEDSGDALSPEQPASHESQASDPSPSSGETRPPEPPCPPPLPTITNHQTVLQPFPVVSQATADFLKTFSTNDLPVSRSMPTPQPITTVAPSKPGPTLVKQSQPKQPGEKSRGKKGKEPKPRVKKLKYHQYVPPDQKQEAAEVPMDSSYARLLHQQQLFLQLQILSQQQQHYNYHTILPAPLKPVADGQSSGVSSLPASIVLALPPPPPVPPSTPVRPNSSLSNRKPGHLPPNLEDMKVAELKLELKLRSLPVSGTKTDLIERLKPYQESPSSPAPTQALTPDPNTLPTSVPMEVISSPAILLPAHQMTPERVGSSPPVSPIPTDVSTFRDEGGVSGVSELFCDPQRVSPGQARGETGMGVVLGHVPEEKDRRLHEKERQIEELMRKLEQEQRLVEELKMQLEVEKSQPLQGPFSDPVPMTPTSNTVKMEGRVLANCSASSTQVHHSHSQPNMIKLEDMICNSPSNPQLQPQASSLTQHQPQLQTQASSFNQHQPQLQPQASSLTQHQPQLQPQASSLTQHQPQLQTQGSSLTQHQPQLQTQASSFNQHQSQLQTQGSSLTQFFISHHGTVSQVIGQPGTQTLLTARDGSTQILLPVLQATVSNQAPCLTSVPQLSQLQTTKMETQQVSTQQANHNVNQILQTGTVCNVLGSGMVDKQTRPNMSSQCFLSNSPDNRLSPRGSSPNHSLSNGPVNKSPSPSSSQSTFILHPSSQVNQPPKTREPPRYEDAVKQTRNLLQANNPSQVSTATSQQMDDLFDILIQSGEITPFIQQQELPSLSNKTVPVTASVTTAPINSALSRPSPQIHVAPPLDPLPSLATDNQLEAFLEGTLNDPSPAMDPRTLGLIEELQCQLLDQPYSPMDTSELSFCDSTSPPSSLNMGLSDTALDNMEWLDLTMPPGTSGGVTSLGIPSDFLDTHDLQLHWD
ncbi:myocardin-related transcription factor B isoform X1 [Esox lucius]|uniref:SAP domain-containing protein n=1 Tax=Esox lucius TaxID=8010 RepID=A0AAY5KZ15_ESOLU|nr:myocardin-related transcription factor B isoform X1 [Esox lucius]XP_019902470.2 myocardin-related transcription factor B isoform X1 [Esox lucius]